MSAKVIRKFRELKKTEKIKVVIAISVSLFMIVALPAYAWFSKQRQLARLAEVIPPTKLYIRAGNEEDVAYIDLSDINVKPIDNVKEKDVVFCVMSDNVRAFELQLAYTTNIPFEYSIYYAEPSEQGVKGDLVYTSPEVGDVNYTKLGLLGGDPLNKDSGENIAKKGDTYYTDTYTSSKDKVQKNAMPVYWRSTPVKVELDRNGKFTQYFILHISWDGKDLANNKETDMIYIIAESCDSSSTTATT